MNIALMLLAAPSLVLPGIATGQELARAATSIDSIPITYTTITANRAGMSSDRSPDEARLRTRNDSTRPSNHVGAHVQHAIVGGFLGTLAGAAIGGGAGAWIDAHPTNDAMFSATILLGIYGAIAGLVVGMLTGAIWPVK
jgi:hypothetical protein